MKRTLSLLLAVLMMTGMLAACAGDDAPDNPSVTTAPGGQPSGDETTPANTTDDGLDDEGYLRDALPADLNFENETISVLYWSDVERQEFFATEQTGEIVNDAILARNHAVEERLGVKLDYHGTKGNGDNMDNYLTFARNSYNAGAHEYDIYGTYSRTMAKLVVNNLCYNLERVKYLDLAKPWWPDNLIDEASFDGRLYFVSGDISTMLLHMMYGVYFNKDLFRDYNLESPYDLVDKNEWTFDKFIELGSNVYQDLDNNNAKDKSDFYGLVYNNYQAEAFYSAAGLHFIDKDTEKGLVLSPDFSSERCVDSIGKLGPFLASDDVLIGGQELFANGQALMVLNRAYYAANYLRNVSFSYGFVPVPKFDSNQDNYYTCMGNPVTLYGITADCETPDMAAAVLECLGSEGYRRTTPALFEINMKVKFSEGETDAKMYDLIKSTTSFDLGRIFAPELTMITDIYWGAVNSNDSAWASKSATYVKVISKQVTNIIKSIRQVEA